MDQDYYDLLILPFVFYVKNKRTSWFQQFYKIVLVLVLLSAIYFALIKLVSDPEGFENGRELMNSIMTLAFGFLLVYLVDLFAKTRLKKLEGEIEKERLLNLTNKLELQAYQSKLEPHFFFNALNNLNSLIRKNPKQAIDFNNHLSSAFRYLISHENLKFVSLEQEIDFAQDYLTIQKTRFEEIQYSFELEEESFLKKIPVFSMQILIENILKHNFISETDPIKIKISSNSEEVVVMNNKVPRTKVDKTGIGHQIIQKMYENIPGKGMKIEETKEEYIVRLPLIE